MPPLVISDEMLGHGTYGDVFKGKLGEITVAIKCVKAGSSKTGVPHSVYREVCILKKLQRLQHNHIVQMRDVIFETGGNIVKGKKRKHSIMLVLEYLHEDLLSLIKAARIKCQPFSWEIISNILSQVLKAVSFLHQHWIVHRDISPSNILLRADGLVKICDLGLARSFWQPLKPLSADGPVVKLWYRAPELLLGAKVYGPPIDMWAVGCVLGEMLQLRPVFRAKEVQEPDLQAALQLKEVTAALGTPSEEDWDQLGDLEVTQRVRQKFDDAGLVTANVQPCATDVQERW
eukprot:CAMPEP_0119330730 /NCGR_PEP_ID=MMETSP1333-20130426/78881_1 /TAXON_ID=418940 /ORGANISM="Scyphosphaera apsteinii, Strain RCC1455" /LENGTH=288 /DNA_ID=CAMNT_0007340173 /DNA_START=10 /DNA_END=873 /DNA_ORIENTATION=-